ncbi:CDP-diacylglycerol diphosphatase [Mycobacterium haemophilum]|uniref:CDP-diacylglycerol diphosphatase n=1 Tax=Mycobacterium haemophilum TaxID=29311 RepID=UPI000AEF5C22|nr:CDP-diacylglycerol diphosphatase [Mycobacterium haemophilum]
MTQATRTKLSSSSRLIRRSVLLAAAIATLTGAPTTAAAPMPPNNPPAASRDALWKIVHDRCELGYQRTGAYDPCTLVDEQSGTALFKASYDPNQYLLLPLARVTGIEDPALQEPASPNYLYDAWAARAFVSSRLNNSLPEPDISLAINPKNARTQDQLHIHISCVSPATAAVLKQVNSAEYVGWKPLPTELKDHTYQALAVNRNTFESKNLFQDVYAKVTADGATMDHASVAVANIAPDQFLLLVAEGTDDQPVAAEELQDHDCSIVRS